MISKAFFAIVFLLNQFSFANNKAVGDESTIKMIPYVFNKTETYAAWLELASPFLTTEEVRSTREFMTKHGVGPEQALPKVIRNGNEFSIGNYTISLIGSGEFKYKGKVFRKQKQESFDQFVARIHTILLGKNERTSSVLDLFVTKAYAADDRVSTGKEVAKGAAFGGLIAAGVAILVAGISISSLPATVPAAAVLSLVKLFLVLTAAETAVVAAGGGAVGYYMSQEKKRVICQDGQMILKTDSNEIRYSFDDKHKLKPNAPLNNSKGETIKNIEKFDEDTSQGLEALYYQACKLNRAIAMTEALDKVQKQVVENKYQNDNPAKSGSSR